MKYWFMSYVMWYPFSKHFFMSLAIKGNHPFDVIAKWKSAGNCAQFSLISYQEITKEEFEKYSKIPSS